jgi:hypothetical protein
VVIGIVPKRTQVGNHPRIRIDSNTEAEKSSCDAQRKGAMLKKIAWASIIAVHAIVPLGNAATRCLTDEERAAIHVRMVQTELMVAALSCRRTMQGRDLPAQYNAFMRKHGEGLVNNSRLIQRYFAAQHGSDWGQKLDAFITGLANDASRRSMDSPVFCDEAVTVFQDALRIAPRDLELWSSYRASIRSTNLDACEAVLRSESASGRR